MMPPVIIKMFRRTCGTKELPVLVAATATPYKFPETCEKAFGENVLDNPPPSFKDLESMPVAQTKVVEIAQIDEAVKELF